MSPDNNRSYAILILRVSLGVLFIAHGLAKLLIFTLPGTVAFFEAVGFAGVLVYPVVLIELLGGSLLVLGVYTRWASLSLVPVMIGATTVHWANGWAFNAENGGWEFPVFLIMACLALFFLGEDGAFALSRRSATAIAPSHSRA